MKWKKPKTLIEFAAYLIFLSTTLLSFGQGDEGVFHFWYGKDLTFGKTGIVQRYVNILGNLDRAKEFTSLNFSLNDGSFRFLSIGPDSRRLQRKGDFNVEIPIRRLMEGKNSVIIEAVDSEGNKHSESVSVTWQPQVRTPNHVIKWGDVSDIYDVAQPIDGLWRIDGGYAISDPSFNGYDRIMGFGDMSWRDYEVLFPFEVRGLDTQSYGSKTSIGPAILYIMRWKGHTNSPVRCAQPHCGYEPIGGSASYAWRKDEVSGWTLGTGIEEDSAIKLPKMEFAIGEQYWFRGRDETTSAGNIYSMKVWKGDLKNEPKNWTARALGGPLNLESGSLLLVAHHVDLAIGAIEFMPIANIPRLILNKYYQHSEIILELPFFALWIIGTVWALNFKKRDPQRGRWVLGAFALFLISSLTNFILLQNLPDYLQNEGWSTSKLNYVYGFIQAIEIGGHLLAWAILFKVLLPPKIQVK